MEHTELPELVVGYMDQGHGHGHYAVLRKESGELFANVPFGDKNLATQVVRACNSFGDLLAAGEAMIEALANCPGEFNYPVLIEMELHAAIAKATGKE